LGENNFTKLAGRFKQRGCTAVAAAADDPAVARNLHKREKGG
jgi:hypothetical protein